MWNITEFKQHTRQYNRLNIIVFTKHPNKQFGEISRINELTKRLSSARYNKVLSAFCIWHEIQIPREFKRREHYHDWIRSRQRNAYLPLASWHLWISPGMTCESCKWKLSCGPNILVGITDVNRVPNWSWYALQCASRQSAFASINISLDWRMSYLFMTSIIRLAYAYPKLEECGWPSWTILSVMG